MAFAKPCRYNCGKKIEWRQANDEQKGKYFEAGTNIYHSFNRCKQLLQEQGQEVIFDSGG